MCIYRGMHESCSEGIELSSSRGVSALYLGVSIFPCSKLCI